MYPHGLPASSPAGWCAQPNDREDAMTDYRINLYDGPGIDSATQASMLGAYRALFEHELGCSFLARQSLSAARRLP